MLDQLLPLLTHKTELDWQSYFDDFDREHGGAPMLMADEVRGDWLVYGDGWSCSLESVENEKPPPADLAERCKLLTFYWRRRRHAVVQERDRLRQDVAGFEALAQQHSLPLRTVSTWWDAEAKAWRSNRREPPDRRLLDLEAMRDRLTWLENDLLACDNKLLKIELKTKGVEHEEVG